MSGSSSQPKAPKGRVLVVDEEPAVRSTMADLLEWAGFAVRVAPDGPTALAIFEGDAFDVVFLDLLMPGMGGIEFIRQAKRLRPDIRILVLTAYGDKESAIEALRLGVTNYLEKPIQNLQALASAMELAMKP